MSATPATTATAPAARAAVTRSWRNAAANPVANSTEVSRSAEMGEAAAQAGPGTGPPSAAHPRDRSPHATPPRPGQQREVDNGGSGVDDPQVGQGRRVLQPFLVDQRVAGDAGAHPERQGDVGSVHAAAQAAD